MQPWISADEVERAAWADDARTFRAELWGPVIPPRRSLNPRVQVDQQRVGDRYLELLAAQRRPVRVARPRSGSDGSYSWVVDETNAEFFRRWQAVLDAHRGGARKGGKSTALARFLDEAERVTGVRPTHVRAHANGDVSVAADGAHQGEPGQWRTVPGPPALPARLAEQLAYPWKEIGYTDAGSSVAVAPVGTPPPSDHWPGGMAVDVSADSVTAERLRAFQDVAAEAADELAERSGVPRRLLTPCDPGA
ncbi:hypothetical protein AB0F93_00200 [Micromonospora tulbaghiae]|uniref:hypothetical protein n=1 Tax=Micromonospora tulbaghiae TaxID=479978 RepID=UPI00331BF5BE